MDEGDKTSISKNEEQKERAKNFLKNSLDTISEIMDHCVENDFYFVRSSKDDVVALIFMSYY